MNRSALYTNPMNESVRVIFLAGRLGWDDNSKRQETWYIVMDSGHIKAGYMWQVTPGRYSCQAPCRGQSNLVMPWCMAATLSRQASYLSML